MEFESGMVGALVLAFFMGMSVGVMILWCVAKFLRRPDNEA